MFKVQPIQVQSHRDITQNPFVRYQKATIKAMIENTVTLMRAPETEIQLIADKALELALLNDALAVFEMGEEAGIEVTNKTTAVSIIEELTGKPWKELSAPTPTDRIAGGISEFLSKALRTINRTATVVAEKTQR